jgi:hypothetical protein
MVVGRQEMEEAGDGFREIDDFLDVVQLGALRASAEERRPLAQYIKKVEPDATLRKIGRAVGVSHTQARRDFGTNVPSKSTKAQRNQDGRGTSVPKPFSGARAAELVIRRETASADRLEKVAEDEQRVLALKPVVGNSGPSC